MRELLRDTGARSILDVGGVGTYRDVVERYKCINMVWEARRSVCTVHNGSQLPYTNASYELTLAETVLHHAAQNATALLADMTRVSSRFVFISEDILERRASYVHPTTWSKRTSGTIRMPCTARS